MSNNGLKERINKCLKGKKLMVWLGQIVVMDEGKNLGTSISLKGFLGIYNKDNPSEAIQYKEIISNEEIIPHFVSPEEYQDYL